MISLFLARTNSLTNDRVTGDLDHYDADVTSL